MDRVEGIAEVLRRLWYNLEVVEKEDWFLEDEYGRYDQLVIQRAGW